MSWSTISSALEARMNAVAGIGKVHARQRWTDEGPKSPTFQNLFVDNNKINYCEIYRKTVSEDFHQIDDDVSVSKQTWAIRATYGGDDLGNSEAYFQTSIVDAIMTDLRTGSRSLGGTIVTYGLPKFGETATFRTVSGVMVHVFDAHFDLEEHVDLSISQTNSSDLPASSGIESQFHRLGNQIISFFASVATDLGLVSWDWKRGSSNDPKVFPALPYSRLPRAYLRGFTSQDRSDKVGAYKGAAEYRYSIWIYMLQTPGQDHQEQLIKAIKKFKDPIIKGGFAPDGMRVGGFFLQDVELLGVVQDELIHPLNSQLRCSLGEINLVCRGETLKV